MPRCSGTALLVLAADDLMHLSDPYPPPRVSELEFSDAGRR